MTKRDFKAEIAVLQTKIDELQRLEDEVNGRTPEQILSIKLHRLQCDSRIHDGYTCTFKGEAGTNWKTPEAIRWVGRATAFMLKFPNPENEQILDWLVAGRV